MLNKLLLRRNNLCIRQYNNIINNNFKRYFSNNNNMPEFYIVDSTLREGEQFATTEFSHSDRVYIAKQLDAMGVDYIEMVNPLASDQAIRDCEAVATLGTKAKILVHTRCHLADVKAAVDTGIDGVNIYMATSSILRQHSHGKGINEVIDAAKDVIGYVQKHGLEVRFSCEDAFRSDLDEILTVYKAIDELNVDRVGVADTVGIATPQEVTNVIKAVRSVIKPTTGIEFHTHNDTGCCIANALVALQAGATHIDTAILGLGERNGITPLGGFLARMYALDKEYIKNRFNLKMIGHMDRYVAQKAHITIPFNNYLSSGAFTHKAGVHSKAVMQSPDAYEIISPDDFGVERRIQFAHRLTGWNAVKQRASDIGLDNITDNVLKQATVIIKNLSEVRKIGVEELDLILQNLAALEEESQKSGKEAMKHSAMEDHVKGLLPDEEIDGRASKSFRIKGHLFDKAVLNRCMDVCVESGCEFKVLDLKVAPVDRRHSVAIIKVWADTDDKMNALQHDLEQLIEGMHNIASCTIMEFDEKL